MNNSMRKRCSLAVITALLLTFFMGCGEAEDATAEQGDTERKLISNGYTGNQSPQSRGHWEDADTGSQLAFAWDNTTNETAEMIAGIRADGGNYHTVSDSYFTKIHTQVNAADKRRVTMTSAGTFSNKVKNGDYMYCLTPVNSVNQVTVDGTTNTATAVSITLPMPNTFIQKGANTPDHLKDYMYMYGETTITSATETVITADDVHFKHIPATLRLSITNKRFTRPVRITKLTATASEAIFPTQAKFQAGTTGEATVASVDGATTQMLTLQMQDAQDTSKGVSVAVAASARCYTLMMPTFGDANLEGKSITFELTVTDEDGMNEHTYTTSTFSCGRLTTDKKFKSGYCYTFLLTLKDELTLNGVTVNPWGNESDINTGDQEALPLYTLRGTTAILNVDAAADQVEAEAAIAQAAAAGATLFVIKGAYANLPLSDTFKPFKSIMAKEVDLTAMKGFSKSGTGGMAVVPDDAFADHYNLNKLSLPTEVQEIPSRQFWNCTALTEISAPEVIRIQKEAFELCGVLKQVYLPKVQYCGIKAFRKCSSIQNLELPALTEFTDDTFEYCNALQVLKLTAAGNLTGFTTPNFGSNTANCTLYLNADKDAANGGTATPPATGTSWNGVTWKEIIFE